MAASDRDRSYRLGRDEEPAAGLTRVAAGRAERALERLGAVESGGADSAEAVHGARKDTKKLRTVLRLLRDELGDERYRRANGLFRDAARALSESRDAEVRLATLDSLAERAEGLSSDAVAVWRQLLDRDREAAADAARDGRAREEAVALLEAGLEEIRGWGPRGDSWRLIDSGLRRTYRRGRRAMAAAERDRREEDFHEWRKRAKDLWYELRLIGGAWPGPLEASAAEAHRLTELLGDHHDLAVLRGDLAARDIGAEEAAALEGAIDRRQEELAAAALPLGRRLYAERPRDFSRRLGRYRRAWRAGG